MWQVRITATDDSMAGPASERFDGAHEGIGSDKYESVPGDV